jgi:hypothetical protein
MSGSPYGVRRPVTFLTKAGAVGVFDSMAWTTPALTTANATRSRAGLSKRFGSSTSAAVQEKSQPTPRLSRMAAFAQCKM